MINNDHLQTREVTRMNLKKSIFVFAICFIFTNTIEAQPNVIWFKQFTFPENYRINTITFIDSLQGWAAGWKPTTQVSGLIVHTMDGGKSWSEQLVDSTFSTSWFNDLIFLDKNYGWATGLHILYKTTDAGENWSRIPDSLFTVSENTPFFDGLGDMQSVSFIDINRGIISGTMGIISSTIDGGQTWLSSMIEPEGGLIDTLHSVIMVNADTACAVGTGGIAITTNSGASWQTKHLEFRNYKKCVFVNDLVGWTLSSDAQILRTDNAGQTWQDLGRIYQDFVSAIDMDFISETTGWVITSAGTIWKTEDGGFSWDEDVVSNNEALTSVDFVKEEVGFATNVKGDFFRTKPDEPDKVDDKPIQSITFSLLPNFPNPFNPETTLKYRIQKQQQITLEIHNLLGQKIVTLTKGVKTVGEHTVKWNGKDELGIAMPSGIYLAKLKSTQNIPIQKIQKMLLIR